MIALGSDVAAAIVAAVGGVIIALVGVFGARKLGLGTSQEKLIETLSALVEANEKKIRELQEEIAHYKSKIGELEDKVSELEKVTIDQALRITSQHDELNQLSALLPKQQQRKPLIKRGGVNDQYD